MHWANTLAVVNFRSTLTRRRWTEDLSKLTPLMEGHKDKEAKQKDGRKSPKELRAIRTCTASSLDSTHDDEH